MRGLAVLFLVSLSAVAQTPEQAAALQRLMLREVPGRAAVIHAPTPADAFRVALGDSQLPGTIEALQARGLPAYLYLERVGADGKATQQQAPVTGPKLACGNWPGLRAARAELITVYLRWFAEDPAATYRVGVGVVGLTP